MSKTIQALVDESARRHGDRTAIEEATGRETDGAITYAELSALSDRVRDRLRHLGIGSGHRVGLYLHKSIDGVAAILGILKCGAAYVPVDPTAPIARGAFILHNCGVSAVFVERRYAADLTAQVTALGASPTAITLDHIGSGNALRAALDQADARDAAPVAVTAPPTPDELAYILYTSGSTGRPKGVMLSHANARSFVDWCSDTFEPTERDRFSSHAPFHFDLSVLDLYVPLKHGAAIIIIGEDVGKDPRRLAPILGERKLTVWYSAPSILSLLVQFGNLDRYDCTSLRHVFFAGEVFPVKYLRAVQTIWPQPRYFNLYGPTETNVCTFYEVRGRVPDERTTPYPIGATCSHLASRVVDGEGRDVAPGQEGELCIAGTGVMQGYWSMPDITAASFLTHGGKHWYRTGDIVITDDQGQYVFIGRRDRMVKRRGYRVELGEIETALYRHPEIKDAAVVALADNDGGVRIKAWLTCEGDKKLSLIELKRFCAEHLPLYMVPDVFSFLPAMPKTSTDKIDYQRLKELG